MTWLYFNNEWKNTVNEFIADNERLYKSQENEKYSQEENSDDLVLCKEVTLEELDSNLARCKNRSAPGQDGISYHLIKKLPKESKTDLCRIFPDAIRLGYFPKLWKTALVKMIPKPNKDTKYAKSYRPISLLPCIGKLLERILASRLSSFMEENKMFKKSPSGFRPGLAR